MLSLFLISFAAAEQFLSPTIAVKLGTDFPGRSLPVTPKPPPAEPKMSVHEEDMEYIDQLEKYYGKFERSIDSLPRYSNVSADRIPWPGSAWATTKDGINYSPKVNFK